MQHVNWILEEIVHGHFNAENPEHYRQAELACNELFELQNLLTELRDEAQADQMPELTSRIQQFLSGL